MTTTDRMDSSGPSNRSLNEVNKTRVLKIQNEMDFSIEVLEAPKEINETEVPHFVSPSKKDYRRKVAGKL